MDVAREQHDGSVARQRPEQCFERRGFVGPRFGIDAQQQAREPLERQQRELHAVGAEHRHAGHDEGDLRVVGRRLGERFGHRRIAEQSGGTFVVDAARLRIAGRETPPRAAVDHQHAMAWTFDPIGVLHQRTERGHRVRRRRERQAEQFLQTVRAGAAHRRRGSDPGAHLLQQFALDATAPSGADRCPTPASACRPSGRDG